MMTGQILAAGAPTIDEQEKDDSSPGINPTARTPSAIPGVVGHV
jgi:hypothetical protein